MILLGQVSLLLALVAAGYASFAAFMGSRGKDWRGARRAIGSSIVTVIALTVVMLVLARALLVKDFTFAYVAQYSTEQLPWQYSLSALWVGQEGSMLLWTWLLGLVVLAFLLHARRQSPGLRLRALSILMAYVFFLTAIIVFAADPMQQSLTARVEGNGLSPLLMHPAMLIHPPVVFLGYAAWGVPFALALAALSGRHADTAWLGTARSWTIFAWVILGSGIILGGNWAYEELGWGGYWAWARGERVSDSLADRHGVDSLPDGLARPRRVEANDDRALRGHLHLLQLCHVSDTQRDLQQSACVQPLTDRLGVLGDDDCSPSGWRGSPYRAAGAVHT
jgi:cytochrome c-type biogenesis protein CcmF